VCSHDDYILGITKSLVAQRKNLLIVARCSCVTPINTQQRPSLPLLLQCRIADVKMGSTMTGNTISNPFRILSRVKEARQGLEQTPLLVYPFRNTIHTGGQMIASPHSTNSQSIVIVCGESQYRGEYSFLDEQVPSDLQVICGRTVPSTRTAFVDHASTFSCSGAGRDL
jgi:hypothetical protein